MAIAGYMTTALVDGNGNKRFHPYVDTSGYLLVIPLFVNKDLAGVTGATAGPFRATTITTDPTITVGGSPVTPVAPPDHPGGSFTRSIPHQKVGTAQADNVIAAVVYQMPSKVPQGASVTIQCSDGWASNSQGTVAGTGGSPMAIDNFSKTSPSTDDTEWELVGPAMQAGHNLAHQHSLAGYPCQVLGNWARRITYKDAWGRMTNAGGFTATSANGWDVRGLPTTIVSVGSSKIIGTFVDSLSVPTIPCMPGMWDIVYSDGSSGVSSTGPKINLSLSPLATGWTATEQGSTQTYANGFSVGKVQDAGSWDATADNGRGGTGAWVNIKKRILITYDGVANPTNPPCGKIRLSLAPATNVGSAAAPISIPPDANGMARLLVCPPSAAGSSTSTLTAAAPFGFGGDVAAASAPDAIDPLFVTRCQGGGVRWMKAVPGGSGGKGDGRPNVPGQLTDGTCRRVNDFLLLQNGTTVTFTVATAAPLSTGADKLAVNIKLKYAEDAGYPAAVAQQTTATWAALTKYVYFKVTTTASHGLVTGDLIQLNANSSRYIPVNYTGYSLTANVADTSQTKFYLNTTTSTGGGLAVNGYLQLSSGAALEQVKITALGSDAGGPFVTVTRAQNGTTASAFTAASTTVRPCINPTMALSLALVVDDTTLVIPAGPFNFGASNANYTADSTVDYTGLAAKPTLSYTYQLDGNLAYEHQAAATAKVAARTPTKRCVCWINIPYFANDATITAVMTSILPYFAVTPNMDLVVEPSNEIWNSTYFAWFRTVVLSGGAPNPETSGTGFTAGTGSAQFRYVASRASRMNTVARTAFTGAGLDQYRVKAHIPGHGQGYSSTHADIQTTLAYCQQYNLPVDWITTGGYAGVPSASSAVVGSNALLNWMASLLPKNPGGQDASAYAPLARSAWNIDTTRAIIASYCRTFARLAFAQRYYYIGLWVSRLNAGVSISGNTINYTYGREARAAIYEGAYTILIPDMAHFDVASITLPNMNILDHDIKNDPAWRATEQTFFQSLQEGGVNYGATAGTTLYPDATDAAVAYLGTYYSIGPWASDTPPVPLGGGTGYPYYVWIGQRAGRGDGTTAHNDGVDTAASSLNTFGWAPLKTITLAADINTTATTVNVSDASTLVVQEKIRIDAEWMLITAISSNTLTVTRAQNNPWASGNLATAAAAHTAGALVLPAGVEQWSRTDGTYVDSVHGQVLLDWNAATSATLAVPTITWADPADIDYGTALSGTQLNASTGVAGTFVYSPPAGTILPIGNTQALFVTFTPTDTATYTTSTKTVHINVNAPVPITPTITWSDPANITYPTALSGTQLNATSGGVAGTFAYTPPSGTVLNAGNTQALTVVFTPTDTVTYTSASKTVHINVLQAATTITWSDPADITYPAPLTTTQLNATASVPGSFVYTPDVGTQLNAGNSQALSVVFTPTDATNYLTSTKTVHINVLAGTPPVQASLSWAPPEPIVVGTALSATQLNATASVPGTFVYTPPAGTVLSLGDDQVLSVTFTPDDSVNWLPATTTTTIDVVVAPGTVVITWPPPAPIVAFTALSDTQLNATTTVPGIFTYTPPAGTRLGVGDDQPLSVTFTPTDTANYNPATASQTIDVIAPDEEDVIASIVIMGQTPQYRWQWQGKGQGTMLRLPK